MASFDRIKEGDILWDCHRERMGNTTMSRMSCWEVLVVSVDRERRTAMCSWNGNPPRLYWEDKIRRLRRTPVRGADR